MSRIFMVHCVETLFYRVVQYVF